MTDEEIKRETKVKEENTVQVTTLPTLTLALTLTLTLTLAQLMLT